MGSVGPYGEVAKHSIDFWLSSEDLPLADSRVTLRRDGAIRLALQPGNNTEASPASARPSRVC